jgi:hypothetical protein
MEIIKALVDYGVWEVLILIAVVAEGWISWKHYQHTKSKKQRAAEKRKATRLIKKVLHD